ncbi:MAG: pyridoxal-dependent decarboxylase [Acidimicrobiales bacterium]|nr:pyridoxal-dependent decarboxylase [Acidimicrobiales bacterium]
MTDAIEGGSVAGPKHMTSEEFRAAGRAAVDWIADFLDDHRDGGHARPIVSDVAPGEVYRSLPGSPPMTGEPFADLLGDVHRLIAPATTQWQHPGFYGFFSANSSPPAILGELLSAGLGVQGMMWSTSPACTELETLVLDWLIEACGLPDRFHSSGPGGGVIQDSASSASLCAVLAARDRSGGAAELPRMRIYTSAQAHSSIEKDVLVAGFAREQLRAVPTDADFAMDADALADMVAADVAEGLLPCLVVATVGTTSSGAIDPVARVCDITEPLGAWVHVDAAWAGSATVCPEHRHLLDGLDRVDSYCFNPHKWLLTNFDCSAFYVADSAPLVGSLSIVPDYLRNAASDAGEVVDYRDWQVPLGRRFRALKLWFVLRSYGIEGLRAHIRAHVAAAADLADRMAANPALELVAPLSLGLVCLRHVDGDEASERLLAAVNGSGRAFLTHTRLDDRYVLRVAVGGTWTTAEHVTELADLLDELA